MSHSQRQLKEASTPEDDMSLSRELPVLTGQKHVPVIGLARRKYVLGQKARSQEVNKGKGKAQSQAFNKRKGRALN